MTIASGLTKSVLQIMRFICKGCLLLKTLLFSVLV